jgi:uncharacterized protein YjiS (DUF1127 family)
MFDHLRARWRAAIASLNRDPDATPVVRRPLAALRLRRRRRAAIADLESLCDHLLDDIGVSRAEIPRVVDGLIAGHSRPVAPATPLVPADEPPAPLRRAA